MTLEELNQAKVLILDLLGWGLSPENLVEAGISKQCLVPCLRELKLRLPSNIDLSDVILFDPPPDINSPYNSSLPLVSSHDGVGQTGLHRNAQDGDEMRSAFTSTHQREIHRPYGGYERKFPPDAAGYTMHSGPTPMAERTRASLLDRLHPAGERETDSRVPQTAGVKGENHVNGSSVDRVDVTSSIPIGYSSVPPKGPRKQGKYTQGGRPAPVGRRKVQGHAVSHLRYPSYATHLCSLLSS